MMQNNEEIYIKELKKEKRGRKKNNELVLQVNYETYLLQYLWVLYIPKTNIIIFSVIYIVGTLISGFIMHSVLNMLSHKTKNILLKDVLSF